MMNDDVKSGGIRKWFRGFFGFRQNDILCLVIAYLLLNVCVCETRTRARNKPRFLFYFLRYNYLLSFIFFLHFELSSFFSSFVYRMVTWLFFFKLQQPLDRCNLWYVVR